MKPLTIIFFLLGTAAMAQDHNIAHFSVWNPKPGQAAAFENGYKQHLLWHKANNDTWNWYGWYIVSGTRTGQFIDVTVNHAWDDFNHSVNPAGDGADNALHTEPFADYLRAYKVALALFSDPADKKLLAAKMLRMFTIDVNDINRGAKLVEKVIADYKTKTGGNFIVYNVVDGGSLKQLIVLVPMASIADMEKTAALPASLSDAAGTITGVAAETLLFKPDMSINVN